MSETRHCLQKMSGSDMQSYMEKQVDGGRWQSGDVHGFHRGSKGSAEFRIIANPTLNQPGDGIIQFRQTGGDYKAPVYDDLRKTIEKPSFQQKRQDWKTKDLSKANFRTKTDKANVMLDFEVARRNDDYLLRSEVEAGIRKAIKSPPKDYPNQAKHMIGMFEGDKADRVKHYEAIMNHNQPSRNVDDLTRGMGKLSVKSRPKRK